MCYYISENSRPLASELRVDLDSFQNTLTYWKGYRFIYLFFVTLLTSLSINLSNNLIREKIVAYTHTLPTKIIYLKITISKN